MEYVNPVFLLLWAAVLCAITALVHSVLGEMKIVRPLLTAGGGVMDSPLARQVTRFAWHWMSVLWLIVAAVLAVTAYGLDLPLWLMVFIGLAHLAFGLIDAAVTRGRHIGWPLITLIGALVLLSAYATDLATSAEEAALTAATAAT